jgi:putative MATE family efflux protein
LKGKTQGVKTLLGNPRKAIIRLSIPMIIAMSVQTVYNVADAVWVAGLSNGEEALAAIGLFFPFFFMIMALATGIGVGGGAAISRRIGARDKSGADNVADHMIVLVVVISLLFTVPMFVLFPEILELMGAGKSLDLSVGYGRIIIGFSFIIFFNNITNAILRAEGDTKRAMIAMVIGSGLNIILDPVFIYIFGLGVEGAAWATMLSFSITLLIMFYWLFFKKDTFVTFNLKDFKPRIHIIKDIMRVGLPSSLQQMSMSFNMIFLNTIVLEVGGDYGVAVFSTGWRVVSMTVLPLMGIATALVSVAGAAYGARSYGKLKLSLKYAIKFGLSITIPVSIIIFTFAPHIVLAFTWSESSSSLRGDLIVLLRFFSLMPYTAAFGMLSGAVFQAIGKGFNSLAATIIRTVILSLLFAFLLGIVLDWGLKGVWTGILFGNAVGATLSYVWIRYHIGGLIKGRIAGK